MSENTPALIHILRGWTISAIIPMLFVVILSSLILILIFDTHLCMYNFCLGEIIRGGYISNALAQAPEPDYQPPTTPPADYVSPVIPPETQLQASLANQTHVIYENPTNNLKLSYPQNWNRTGNENNFTLLSLLNKNDSFQENININISPSGNVPLDESASLDIIKYKQNNPQFKLFDFGFTSIADNRAYKVVYTFSNSTDSYKVLDLRTIVGGKLYSFIFTSNLEQYAIFLPVVNKIIDSLEIQGLTKQSAKTFSNLPKLRVVPDPYDIVSDPTSDRVYIVNFRSHSVSAVNDMTDRLLTEIKVGRFPLSISVNPDFGTLYVANSRSNSISVIDSSDNEVSKEISVGNHPVAVVVDSIEKGLDSLAFVANLESNSVSVIDATRNEPYSPTLSVGREPSDLVVNEVVNRLYVANRGSDSVSVIDYLISNDGKFKNTTITNIKVQKYPSNIAINPSTNRIYVANYYSNTVSVIDGSSNTVIDTISVGSNPSSIAINPSTNRIYVANYGSNTVSAIDGKSDKLLVNIGVGSFPHKVYYNPNTHIIYVLSIGSKTMSQIKDTSLVAGITFNVNPSDAGQIDCNGTKISDVGYERYKVGSEIICKAKPGSDYVFKSWSASIPLQKGTSSITSFNSSDYGNVTANFQVPVEITLPKAYWEQLYVVLFSIMVPAIVGWSIPAIAGYVNTVRQRKVLRKIMGDIIHVNNNVIDDIEKRKLLEQIRIEFEKKLTEGKISESQYEILNNKVSERLTDLGNR